MPGTIRRVDLHLRKAPGQGKEQEMAECQGDLEGPFEAEYYNIDREETERISFANHIPPKSDDLIQKECAQIGRKAVVDQNAATYDKLQKMVQEVLEGGTSFSAEELVKPASSLRVNTRNTHLQNLGLQDLYFESMFLREHSVDDPEDGTFDWLVKLTTDSPSQSIDSSADLLSSSGIGDGGTGTLDEANVSGSHDDHGTFHSDADSAGGNMISEPTSENDDHEASLDDTASFLSYSEDEGYTLEYSARQETARAFNSFLEEESGLFFICRKAGSGKSTMMKHLAYHRGLKMALENWSGEMKLIFVRCFFWNSGDRLQMSLEGFYRFIFFEILKQAPDLIQVIFPDVWSDMQSFTQPADALLRIGNLKPRMECLIKTHLPDYSVFLMVDGLDEYEGDVLEHFELARLLKQWSTLPGTKVLCSARPHTEFIDTFNEPYHTILLHELTRSDIRFYAQAQLGSRTRPGTENEIQSALDTIVEQIVEMADGVFLWARLVLRSLVIGVAHGDSAKALLENLEGTPRDINKLFESILNSVEPTVRHRSDQMLSMAVNNPFHQNLNAMCFSWIEDLDDPAFPFNRPIEGLPNAEIGRRHQKVKRQLDARTGGLLEFKKYEDRWTFIELSGDDNLLIPYWKYAVGFLHRSVKDFLRDYWRQYGTRRTVPVYDHLRLRLAEAQFGVSTKPMVPPNPDQHLLPLCSDIIYVLGIRTGAQIPRDKVHTLLDHLEKTTRTWASLYLAASMTETELKRAFWSSSVVCTTYFVARGGYAPDLDYLAYIARTGCFAWYVKERLAENQTNGAVNRMAQLCKVMIAISCVPNRELVKYLFSNRLSPSTNVPIMVPVSGKTGETLEHKSVPLWFLFLRMYFYISMAVLTQYQYAKPTFRQVPAFGQVLIECLRAGAQQDIVVLAFINNNLPGSDDKLPSRSILKQFIPDPKDIFYKDLKQAISISRLPDKDTAEGLLNRSKSIWRFWEQTMATGLLSRTELANPAVTIYGVVSDEAELVGSFEFIEYGYGTES
ncbi:hypothetical protein BX600DRAFT_525011 [Xylariales sp. PMI_506]|nr:hypothetical protein BX600DRAFT_525011 [Xylariales sp. PMI_506]